MILRADKVPGNLSLWKECERLRTIPFGNFRKWNPVGAGLHGNLSSTAPPCFRGSSPEEPTVIGVAGRRWGGVLLNFAQRW